MSRVSDKVRAGVQLTESSKRSVKDVERARNLTGGAKATADRVIRRKRANRRALDNTGKRQNQGSPGSGER